VFVLQSGGNRQARGIVSAGNAIDGIRWTEAPYIFAELGLKLANATDPTVGAQSSGAVVFNGWLYEFTRGADGTIRYWFANGGPWSAMQTLGGYIVSDPVATVFNSYLYVFAIGADGTIKYWFGNGGPWSAMQTISGSVSGGLSSTVYKGFQYV